MQGNSAGSIITGLHPDENYAREIQQLFSIGLNRMWPDGTLIMNSQGNLVPTYNQNVVMGYAAVFTGWKFQQNNQTNGRYVVNFFHSGDIPDHGAGADLPRRELWLLLDNVTLPQDWGNQTNSAT